MVTGVIIALEFYFCWWKAIPSNGFWDQSERKKRNIYPILLLVSCTLILSFVLLNYHWCLIIVIFQTILPLTIGAIAASYNFDKINLNLTSITFQACSLNDNCSVAVLQLCASSRCFNCNRCFCNLCCSIFLWEMSFGTLEHEDIDQNFAG